MALNTSYMKPTKRITIFIYQNASGIVPNNVGIYGSAYKEFYLDEKNENPNQSFDASFVIKESHTKALDKQSQRCNTSKEPSSVSKCVGHYVENNLNCSMHFLMSNSMLETCNLKHLSKKELEQIYKFYKVKVKTYEESQLYDLTGCIPGCYKKTYELKAIKLKPQVNTRMELQIQLQIPNGEYELTEEYLLYDFNSFIPDVGGYLGLLLGYSLLSMYQKFIQWITVVKHWLLDSSSVKLSKHKENKDLSTS